MCRGCGHRAQSVSAPGSRGHVGRQDFPAGTFEQLELEDRPYFVIPDNDERRAAVQQSLVCLWRTPEKSFLELDGLGEIFMQLHQERSRHLLLDAPLPRHQLRQPPPRSRRARSVPVVEAPPDSSSRVRGVPRRKQSRWPLRSPSDDPAFSPVPLAATLVGDRRVRLHVALDRQAQVAAGVFAPRWIEG